MQENRQKNGQITDKEIQGVILVGITETTDARKQGRDKKCKIIYLQEEELINEFF